MATQRFSKAWAIQALYNKAAGIAHRNNFDRGNGTSQLKSTCSQEELDRAINYGRMRALEEFAVQIEEGRV